jgi:hypothetical protein
MFLYWSHSDRAISADPSTPQKFSERPTTLSTVRNTTLTRFLAAPRSDAGSWASSSGLTFPTDGIGPKSHSTTSQLAVWRNSESFIDEIQTCRGTTGSPMSREFFAVRGFSLLRRAVVGCRDWRTAFTVHKVYEPPNNEVKESL